MRTHSKGVTATSHRLFTAGPNLGDYLTNPLGFIKTGTGVHIAQQTSEFATVSSQGLAIEHQVTRQVLNVVDTALGIERGANTAGFGRNTILHLQIIQITTPYFRNQ